MARGRVAPAPRRRKTRAALARGVAHAVFVAHAVEPLLERGIELELGGRDVVGELLGLARADDRRRDRRVCERPCDRERRRRHTLLARKLRELLDGRKFALPPVALAVHL